VIREKLKRMKNSPYRNGTIDLNMTSKPRISKTPTPITGPNQEQNDNSTMTRLMQKGQSFKDLDVKNNQLLMETFYGHGPGKATD
jgi:hypothetical protein